MKQTISSEKKPEKKNILLSMLRRTVFAVLFIYIEMQAKFGYLKQ